MQPVDQKANEAEVEILRMFRAYRVGACEMLFFNQASSKPRRSPFTRALQSLIERGLVIKERHPDAYSLTQSGYQASLVACAP